MHHASFAERAKVQEASPANPVHHASFAERASAQQKAAPVETSANGSGHADATKATGPTPLPLTPAGYATTANVAAAPAATETPPASVDAASPRAVRAASIPPSAALERSEPSSPQPAAPTVAATSPSSSASETVLLSTAKRGTRVIGATNDDAAAIDLNAPPAPRSQSSSIWSSTYPRPSVAYTMPAGIDGALPTPAVRAERVPVRAETVLVRRTNDGATSSDTARTQDNYLRPSVGNTLPPEARGGK